MEVKAKRGLRKGFTTGTAAAAAAKAALVAVLGKKRPRSVLVTLPDNKKLKIPVSKLSRKGSAAEAVVIKDAGDDPDVTHLAEIAVLVEVSELKTASGRTLIRIKGGEGVGTVTKPGLKIAPGRPAINPVPLKMIRRAVREAVDLYGKSPSLTVTVKVPRGKELAKKTMNERLGIVGGISILGTTGIVHPLSLAAYCHSISAAIDVAVAAGLKEVVFSTGRSSEKVVEKVLKDLPPEAFILTGDHMGYALEEARKRATLRRVTVAGQFAKFSKLARGEFKTHCSDVSIELDSLATLAKSKGGARSNGALIKRIKSANTAREVSFIYKEAGLDALFVKICNLVEKHAQEIVGKRIDCEAMLVGYDAKLEARSK